MRNVTCFVLAAALVATPALAQDNAAENAVDLNTEVAAPADNAAMMANDVAAEPVAEPVATEAAPAPAPAPERSRGFPWGAIGLVGLIGLLGRKRRD